jgi:hypothetical protein
MLEKLPQRPDAHQLEEKSERFFHGCLPRNWTAERPKHDYGVDLRVDINDGSDVTGHELLVQLKASARPSADETERMQLKVSTFNLLRNKLQVVILVKYIEEENEAYWLLLKSIQVPSQDQETFTVHIPKTNRLSVAPWDEIAGHVQVMSDQTNTMRYSGGFVGITYVPDDKDDSDVRDA